MSIEDLTQEEWDEHHKQLDKHLDGVEKRHIARLGAAMGFSREWVGLTEEEIKDMYNKAIHEITTVSQFVMFKTFARAIEAKLQEKNT